MEYGIVANWSGYPFNSQGKLVDASWGSIEELQQVIEDYALEAKKDLTGDVYEIYMDDYCRYQKGAKIGSFTAVYSYSEEANRVNGDLPPYMRGAEDVEWGLV